MSTPDLKDARTALEQILREIDGAASVLANQDPEDDIIDGPHDDVDEAAELSDLGREELIQEASDERRAEVQAAIDRIDAGTYGICIDCGQPIDAARLEFRPEAARCLPDQERFEA